MAIVTYRTTNKDEVWLDTAGYRKITVTKGGVVNLIPMNGPKEQLSAEEGKQVAPQLRRLQPIATADGRKARRPAAGGPL